MGKIIGLAMIVVGVALGLYVGVYAMLIGGILQIIEAAKGGVGGLRHCMGGC